MGIDSELRRRYAGQALVGFQVFIRGGWSGVMTREMADNVAANCFALADAMLRAEGAPNETPVGGESPWNEQPGDGW